MMDDTKNKQKRAGYLLKKGQVNTAWKVRWCVLKDDKLYYHKNPEQSKPIGYIPLDQAVVRSSTEDVGKEHCFEIVTKERVFRLVAGSQQDMVAWIQALSPYTILHTENELIDQAEERICAICFNKSLEKEKQVFKEFDDATKEER